MPETADWQELADAAAQVAHDLHFEVRRDVVHLVVEDTGDECVLVYNNNPYACDDTLRPRELAETMRRLRRRAGIDDLAIGHFPPRGEEDRGYTQTLLLAAGAERVPQIAAIVEAVRQDFTAPLLARGTPGAPLAKGETP